MKQLLLTGIAIAFATIIWGQNADQQVISSSGGDMSSGQYSLSWTLGEPVTATHENQNIILTQGFHQPMDVPTGIDEQQEGEILVYPNPTRDQLHFDLPTNLSVVDVRIHDLHGKVISGHSAITGSRTINLNNLASGTYILTIINPKNQEVEKRLKIQKVH
jgi:hypothetical protein